MLLKKRWILGLAGGRLENFGNFFVSWIQMRFLRMHKDPELLRELRRTRRSVGDGGGLLNEAYLLRSLALSLADMPGDFAELGVWNGGSAAMICLGKGDKRLHLFDTFAGLPKGDTGKGDPNSMREKMYACSREQVEENLSRFSNLSFHEGLFPDSTRGVKEVEDTRYALVHLDVDLYQSTLDGLKYFYPRLLPGAIIVSHDFWMDGVRNAFDEFLLDKPEVVVDLPTTQCMFVKLPEN